VARGLSKWSVCGVTMAGVVYGKVNSWLLFCLFMCESWSKCGHNACSEVQKRH